MFVIGNSKPIKDRITLASILSFRVASICFINNFYLSDEYWQNLEVAHRQVFGYGYLTWEWNYKTRSYIYPSIISIIYKLLAITRLDYPMMLIYVPRLCQSLLSGYAEYRFYKWSNSAKTAVFLTMNPLWVLCASRTLTYTLESSLLMIALSIFPWKNKKQHGSKFLWLVSLMFFIRPASVMLWDPLCLYYILICNKSNIKLMREILFIGLSTAGIVIAVDSYCYGELVITPWEFLKVNLSIDFTNCYEEKSNLWYLFVTTPYFALFLVAVLPFVLLKISKNKVVDEKLIMSIILIGWIITIHLLHAIKGHHFILQVLPLLLYVAMQFDYPKFITEDNVRKVIAFLCIGNCFFCYVLSQDRIGSLKIMKHLRDEVATSPPDVDVMFLTPCYSTPFYSHVHQNISMEFLTCDPNLQNQVNYVHETDLFFKNPMDWLGKRYANSSLPKLMLMYDNLVPRIKTFIGTNYKLIAKEFDSESPFDYRGNDILLYKLK